MIDERARGLLMMVVDEEHSPEQRRELEALAAGSEEIRIEWARLARVKEATRTMSWQHLPEETWDRYWMSVYNRLERKIAWLLVIVGGLALAGWQLWLAAPDLLDFVFEDESMPAPIRAAVVTLGLGVIVLIVSVVREQLVSRARDRYKGVVR
jgi:hypothetical protein